MAELKLNISSIAFENNASIPARYTCDGENISPPLRIDDIPEMAQSLVIIVDDPDAPDGTFTHWIAWDIPPRPNIEENTWPGGVVGPNGFGEFKYLGPCPPSGEEHRYFFKIYALDSKVDLDSYATREAIEVLIAEKKIAYGELVGLYKKARV